MITANENADDRLLLRRMKENDEGAFTALYDKYWRLAYDTAYKRLNDTDLAKDLVQDIFVQLWNTRTSSDINNFPAWLTVAIRNNVYRYMQREKRLRSIKDLLLSVGSNNQEPDHKLLYKEFLVSYEKLINSLPEGQQTIFRLHYIDDLSTDLIAERLNISRKTVQNQLAKAKVRFKALLILMVISEYLP
jgi:RNA polymerase sigma-70 factor (ECF subfamily)